LPQGADGIRMSDVGSSSGIVSTGTLI
jgi:hypothetical protein